jgi:hypothetical protein
MFHLLINYNFTPDWVKDKDYLIYDRSDSKEYLKDFNQSKIIYTENVGNVDHDKLTYLVENYDILPDVFLWSKSNLFKYISLEEYKKVANSKHFTPLLTQNHQTYSDDKGVVCYYEGGMYHERNDNWYAYQFQSKYCKTYNEWAVMFGLPRPDYIPFAPGGSYILTRETVHKYSKDFYAKMASILTHTQLPLEAYFAERSYYQLWR